MTNSFEIILISWGNEHSDVLEFKTEVQIEEAFLSNVADLFNNKNSDYS